MSNIFDDINSNYFNIVKSLKCPVCGIVATQTVSKDNIVIDENFDGSKDLFDDYIVRLTCHSCHYESVWLTRKFDKFLPRNMKNDKGESFYKSFEFEKLLYPFTYNESPEPNKDMPADIIEIYNEASLILKYSPRASAALARLSIEKLVNHLGAEGNDLNEKIGNLSKNGLGDDVIQMLDIIRIYGNNAVHPGVIEIDDDKNTAILLLEYINLIVRDTITRKNELKKMYDKIPEGRRKAIEKRDTK